VVVKSLNLGLGAQKRTVGCLNFGFMGKNPFDIWMGILPRCLCQFEHVSLDPCGGDIKVLEIE
jgi:hypothetical protein